MKEFYVYIYFDPTKKGDYNYGNYNFKLEPFYVGKGKNKQLYSHIRESKNITDDKKLTNTFKTYKIRKIQKNTKKDPIIKIFKNNLKEKDAFKLEINLILNIGKRIDNKGPLTNITDGGEGLSGYKPTKEENLKNSIRTKEYFSKEENRKKQSDLIKEAHKNNPSLAKNHSIIIKNLYDNNPEKRKEVSDKSKEMWLNKEYQIQQSNSHKQFFKDNPEAKIEISKFQKKRFQDPKIRLEHSKKIKKIYETPKLRNLHAKKWIVTEPSGEIHNIKNLLKFCYERKMTRNNYDYLRLVANGKLDNYKGWLCKRI